MEQPLRSGDERELGRFLTEIEARRRELQGLLRRIEMLEALRAELDVTLRTFDALKTKGPGSSLLVPLGGACYAKAELKDNSKVLVSLGANVVVEKDVEDAKRIVEGRGKVIESAIGRLRGYAEDLGKRLEELESEARKLIEKLRKSSR